MEKLSVYIITKDGKSHLTEVLASVKDIADEVIVVSSVALPDPPPDTKFFVHEFKNHCDQKRFAESKCTNRWLLNLDDDEVLTRSLIDEIKLFLQNPLADACNLKIGDMFPGYTQPKKCGRTYNIARMYDKTAASMADNLTADRIVFKVKQPAIHQFKNMVKHYSYQGLQELIVKQNLFTDMVVANMLKKNKKYSFWRIYVEFPTQFFKYYFLKKYIFNGYYGFLVSIVYSFFRVVRLGKYREAVKNNKSDS